MSNANERERDEQGRELLPPVVYEPVYDEAGVRIGWRLSAEERATAAKLRERRAELEASIAAARAYRESGLFCEECGRELTGRQKRYCSSRCNARAHFRPKPPEAA